MRWKVLVFILFETLLQLFLVFAILRGWILYFLCFKQKILFQTEFYSFSSITELAEAIEVVV